MNYQNLPAHCPSWSAYIHHDFVQQLITGALPLTAFRRYLEQDYLFLLQFVRAWGLAVYKSDNLADMRAAQMGINALLDVEIQLHLDYCASYGVDAAALAQLTELPATVAYTRYVLDCGQAGTLADLHVALAPCIVGYAEIGKHAVSHSSADNPYQSWIDMYASTSYQTVAADAVVALNRLIHDATPAQQHRYQQIFNTATAMEIAFWQTGLTG